MLSKVEISDLAQTEELKLK